MSKKIEKPDVPVELVTAVADAMIRFPDIDEKFYRRLANYVEGKWDNSVEFAGTVDNYKPYDFLLGITESLVKEYPEVAVETCIKTYYEAVAEMENKKK